MHSPSFSTQTLAILAVLPTLVRSHGYVTKMTSGSTDVETWAPFVDPYADPAPSKPTRKINSDGPVDDVSSSTIVCGAGADDPVSTVTKGFNAGDEVTMQWTTWPADHRGPVMTYMASCDGDCSTFDATQGKWFKIDEKGYENGKWASDTLIDQGSSWTFTIPASLKAGEYIIRHEILALHSAYQQGGAQFYPSCNQISLTSSGSLVPDGVALPGAYSANDPGIFVDIWADGFNSYQIPGPAVISGSSSGSASGSSTGSDDESSDDSSSSSSSGSDDESSDDSSSGSSDESSAESGDDSGDDSSTGSDNGSSSGSGSVCEGGSKGGRKGGSKTRTATATSKKTTSAKPAAAPEDSGDDSAAEPAPADGQPALITSQPALITSQPPLVTSQPPLVTSQPPLVTSQPPLVTSQPPLVTEIPGLRKRALAAASVPTGKPRLHRRHARALPRKGHRLQ